MKINDEILISYVLHEAEAAQKAAVEQWLGLDPANVRELDQYRRVWEAGHLLQLEKPMDAHASLARFKQRTPSGQIQAAKVVPLQRSYRWMKIAATLLLTGGLLWLYVQRSFRQVVLSTARFEVKADTLSDGSIVTLNQNTILSHTAHFHSGLREVALKNGEAFFKIAHLPDQPFVVRSGNLRIQVIGTSFNVKNKSGRIEVIVETGMVAVISKVSTIYLRPGDKLSIGTSNNHLSVSHNTDRLYQYYRTKEFIADDTPLEKLVTALNEAYGSRIIIANPKLAGMKLNTTFRNDSLNDILDVISRTFHIRVVKSGEVILLK